MARHNQLNVQRMKSIVVNKLFRQLYDQLTEQGVHPHTIEATKDKK